MVTGWIDLPEGATSWKSPVIDVIDLPANGNTLGDARAVEDTGAIYVWNGTNWITAAGGGGSGTVTSVGLTDNTGTFNITGSPVTGAGVLTLAAFNSQAQHTFLAAPSGTAGAPTWRLILASDIPILNQNTTGTASNITATSNSTLTTLSALTLPTSQLSGQVTLSQLPTIASATILGNASGGATTPSALTTAQVAAILPVFTSSLNGLVPASGGGTTNFLRADGTWAVAGSGTVTSVAFADSSTVPIYTVSGSPITSSGTITETLVAQAANTVFSGPSSGANAQPTFRTLVSNDIPALPYVTSVSLADATGLFNITGSPVTSSGTLELASLQAQAQHTFLAGPSGGSGAPSFRLIAVSDVPTLNQNTTGTAANITGVAAVANGGTGQSAALTQYGVIYAASATAMASTAVGTTGNALISNGTSAPTFQKLSLLDVTGTLPIANGGTNATTVAGARTSLGIESGSSFITSGTTFTTPSTITASTQFKFTLIGGGAGGSSADVAAAHSSAGGGAGGGILYITGLTASTAYTIAIGAAGAGGASTLVGGAGGNTTLTIGATTYTAGGGAAAAAVTGPGGTGGTATNCTINISGQAGGASMSVFTSAGMPGGNSPWGWGYGGVGVAPSTAANGNPASGYGGGGGGSASNGAPTGGAGTAGCILVEWYN